MRQEPIHNSRLQSLRTVMKKAGISGLFVPRTDEFQGEYVPPSAERLNWLTGFSGSWGTALVGLKSAALIVDGRYTVQAARETTGYELVPPDNNALSGFLSQNFKAGESLAFDPWITSISEARRLRNVTESEGLKLVVCPDNLVDAVWQERPKPPQHKIFAHPVAKAGETVLQKLQRLKQHLIAEKVDFAILSDPHSVAWLLNIRGSDIPHTPIPLVRAVLESKGKVTLFAQRDRCNSDVISSFENYVKFADPATFVAKMTRLAESRKTVLMDANSCPEAVRNIFSKHNGKLVEGTDPVSLPRARKNSVEQQGARKAHLRDGAALTDFLCWLHLTAPKGNVTEREAQDKLELFRRKSGKLRDLSFGSISASGPNAALPHYHVTSDHGRTLKPNEIYLIDSGGQYQDGTTDVTRTVIIGTASAQMKTHYTLVLKGMIAVSMARFPAGTTGAQLDSLARTALWQRGLDFDHGTGHGVGSYLSVHEGPARLSKTGFMPLRPGMILSNEPGYYVKGKYGIRIENLLLVKPAEKIGAGTRPMLSFETLTFAPIDKQLIEVSMLTQSELQWLNSYHQDVLRKLGGRVSTDCFTWLESACSPLTAVAE